MILSSGKDVKHAKTMMFLLEQIERCAFALECYMTQKIKNMKNKIVVLAYSGGLDTSYCLKKLSSDGYQVHAITINTGGFSNEEINQISKKLKN